MSLSTSSTASGHVIEVGGRAHWLVPGAATILDMGGQDCKAIRVNERGGVTNFVMNDKSPEARGASGDHRGRPEGTLFEIGELSLTSTKDISFNNVRCLCHERSRRVHEEWRKQGRYPAGLHEVISQRAVRLLERVGIEE
jgi:activator of 2-hydroxyglutaryl-CoA dehydratase